jgi:poly(3-hydroxybutyrate) depolymerase
LIQNVADQLIIPELSFVARDAGRFVRLLAATLLVVAVPACGGNVGSAPPFLTRTYTMPDGEVGHYVVFVPPNRKPDAKLPVILFLNGWGENGDDGLRQISNNFGGDVWRMRASFPFLCVCPQCSYNAEWTPGSKNAELALAVLDEAIREFGGDADRVTITGASTGGAGALRMAVAHPERFAAVVPVAAPIHPPPAALRGAPVWLFYNSGDAANLVQGARDSRRTQRQGGNAPLVTEFAQKGHNAWDGAYGSPALYQWLLEQRASGRDEHGLYEFIPPAELVARWTTGDGWHVDDDAVAGRPGSSPFKSPPLQGDWDVRFDVQLTEREPLELAVTVEDSPFFSLRAPLADDGLMRVFGGQVEWTGQRGLHLGWNDVRIRRRGSRIFVSVNGWSLARAVIADPPPRVHVAIPAGQKIERRIRELQVRMALPGGMP